MMSPALSRHVAIGSIGANGIRTHDLLHAMQALSHLSYGPGRRVYYHIGMMVANKFFGPAKT